MPRPRSLPDVTVLAQVRSLLALGGEKAVSFSTVAQATGLAPATLAGRYGSIPAMIQAAALDALTQSLAALARAEAEAPDKGAHSVLKSLGAAGPDAASLAILLRSETGRAELASYRQAVLAALTRRLGPKSQQHAATLFAAWSGAALWSPVAPQPFRLKDLARKLG